MFILLTWVHLLAAMVRIVIGLLVSRVKSIVPEDTELSHLLLIRIAPWIARLGLLLGLAVLLAAVALVRT